MSGAKPRVLAAGMGNDLRRDDGFGIAVVRRLLEGGQPDGVRAIEAGIAGLGLVQELMDGYEALIILDATDRGGPPGTVYLLEAEVPELEDFTPEYQQDFLADTHYTVPSKALILARALGVLPDHSYILACQPDETELGIGLSEPVERGVEEALVRLRHLCGKLVREQITP